MNTIVKLIRKVALWLMPYLITACSDFLETAIRAVGEAAELTDENARRQRALAIFELAYPAVPENLRRMAIQAAEILHDLGVTADMLDHVEGLVLTYDVCDLTSAQKRWGILEEIGKTFPEVPERAARLVVELAVAKLRAAHHAS